MLKEMLKTEEFWVSACLLTVLLYLIYMVIVQFSLELPYYFSGFFYIHIPIQFFNKLFTVSFPLDILFIGGLSLIATYILSLLNQ